MSRPVMPSICHAIGGAVLLWGVMLATGCDPDPDPADASTDADAVVDAAPACAEGEAQACVVDGACVGMQVCSAGVFGACEAPPEVCDGVDNDCDGVADEDWPDVGDDCEVGAGACAASGRVVCSADGATVACDAVAGDGGEEMCDGVDNDCDGVVDEGIGIGADCNTGLPGECGEGRSTCEAGAPRCVPVIDPADELCNGRDDDCDGRTDEAEMGGPIAASCYAGPVGTEGVGACVAGVEVCEGGAWTVCDGAVLPSDEICDGVDNDCDGETDELADGACVCTPGERRACYGGAAGTEGVGVCVGGEQVCAADGSAWGRCLGEVAPSPERCDGLDRDCDGAVDEVAGVGEACTAGEGACAVDGVRVCDLGSGQVVCDALAGLPADEICNGIDDDCDGVVDDVDGFGMPCRAGEGACAAAGVMACGPDGLACDAAPGAAADESCNGIDDDCDGVVDEDVDGAGETCSAGDGACRSDAETVCDPRVGAVVCPAVPRAGSDERCNRIDDDCDGAVDEAPECGECLDDGDCGADEICEAGACVAIAQACLAAGSIGALDDGQGDGAGVYAGVTLDDPAFATLDHACGGSGGPEAVYRLDLGDYVGTICLDATGSAFDTTLSVRAGGCTAGAPEVACGAGPLDPDAVGDAAQVEVDVAPDAELYVVLDGADPSAFGDYVLTARPGPCGGCATDAHCAPGLVCAEGACVPEACGDGVLDAGEGCDDGDNTSGDGCDAACAVEDGFVCFEAPTPVERFGRLNARDACTAANAVPLDLPVWPAYNAFYVSGALRYAYRGRNNGRFAVAVTRGEAVEVVQGPYLGRSGDPADVPALYARYSTGVFDVDPGAEAGLMFPDGNCGDNSRRVELEAVVRSVSACRPAVCADDADCFRPETCEAGVCVLRGCGDGVVGPGEVCDDGGRDDGDGCDGRCAIEPGYACYDPPADARADGVVIHANTHCGAVDNGVAVDVPPWPAYRGFYGSGALSIDRGRLVGRFTVSVDGERYEDRSRGSAGTVEEVEALYAGHATPPFAVTGDEAVVLWHRDNPCGDNVASEMVADVRAVSACRPTACADDAECFDFEVCAEGACVPRTCGDGLLDAGEGCDDGGRRSGDGCAADCRVEDGWYCVEPEDIDEVPFELAGRRDCGSAPGSGVHLAPAPWDAWRAFQTGGGVRFSADGRRAFFVVAAIDGAVVSDRPVDPLIVGAADEAALVGQATHPAFATGEGEGVEVYFDDANCDDNGGALQGVLRPVSACRPRVCTQDDECLGAELCVDGDCVVMCADHGGCAVGERCRDGLCVVAGCADDGACDDGEICAGGVCVAGCREDAACPPGWLCVAEQCISPPDPDGDGLEGDDDIDSDGDGIPDAYECPEGGDRVVNGGFERPDVDGVEQLDPAAVPGWSTGDGSPIELRDDGVDGVAAYAGDQFGAHDGPAIVYQDLVLPAGEIDVSLRVRGRGNGEQVDVRLGPPDAAPMVARFPAVIDRWLPYYDRHAVPADQPVTRITLAQSEAGDPAGRFIDEVRVLVRCAADTDTDGDGLVDRLDLDSDGDGIYDAEEAGHGLPHTDGVVDGEVGANGLVDAAEIGVDSGHLSYAIADDDADGVADFLQVTALPCIDGQVDCGRPECAALPMCTPLAACPVDDRFEDNDDRSVATGLLPGAYDHLSACGESDVYRFTVCEGGFTFAFDLESGGGTYDEYIDGQAVVLDADLSGRRPGGSADFMVTREVVVHGDAELRYGVTLTRDEECAGAPPEPRCDDGHDDDFDGLFDCADPDCADDPHCSPAQAVRACRAIEPWSRDTMLWGDNRRGVDEIGANGCGETPGPESVHAFSGSEVPAVVCVRVDENPGGQPIALSVRGGRCDDPERELGCAVGPAAAVSVETDPGERYYAIVDAPPPGFGGAHRLRLLPGYCDALFDEVCDNGRDEDADGLIDCADDDCARDPTCVVPSAECEAACEAMVDCVDYDIPQCPLACALDGDRHPDWDCATDHLVGGQCDELGFQTCLSGA